MGLHIVSYHKPDLSIKVMTLTMMMMKMIMLVMGMQMMILSCHNSYLSVKVTMPSSNNAIAGALMWKLG